MYILFFIILYVDLISQTVSYHIMSIECIIHVYEHSLHSFDPFSPGTWTKIPASWVLPPHQCSSDAETLLLATTQVVTAFSNHRVVPRTHWAKYGATWHFWTCYVWMFDSLNFPKQVEKNHVSKWIRKHPVNLLWFKKGQIYEGGNKRPRILNALE